MPFRFLQLFFGIQSLDVCGLYTLEFISVHLYANRLQDVSSLHMPPFWGREALRIARNCVRICNRMYPIRRGFNLNNKFCTSIAICTVLESTLPGVALAVKIWRLDFEKPFAGLPPPTPKMPPVAYLTGPFFHQCLNDRQWWNAASGGCKLWIFNKFNFLCLLWCRVSAWNFRD